MMCDITSNCNLRCPFCVNDWGQVRGNINMSKEKFSELLVEASRPEVEREGFFISCAFEPTLHPDLGELLEMIPVELKHKAFFSTNLSLHLSDDWIRQISTANINHVNVSLESLQPELYETLRRGAKYEVFADNLHRLSEAFKSQTGGPRLRFITMLLRQNVGELRELVTSCRDWFNAEAHEVRTPFQFSLGLMTQEFQDESILSHDEAQRVKRELRDLPIIWHISERNGSPPDVRVEADGKGLLE